MYVSMYLFLLVFNWLKKSYSGAISYLQVPNVFVTTNLDLPESSFDALVQVLACEQELGWRNRSVDGPERGLQRLVLLITDNQPHLAGDGRVRSCVFGLGVFRALRFLPRSLCLSWLAYINPMMGNVM